MVQQEVKCTLRDDAGAFLEEFWVTKNARGSLGLSSEYQDRHIFTEPGEAEKAREVAVITLQAYTPRSLEVTRFTSFMQ